MLAKKIANKIVFDFGDRVEFALRKSGDVGIVGEILLSPGQIQYKVIWSDKQVHSHYEFELKKVE